VVRLMLRGKTLGSVLDWLTVLLLLRLLGRGSGGIGRGGRRVTLGMRVTALVHRGIFAIPIFERDQDAHVQLREELGGRKGIWGRKLFREVKQLQDVMPCTSLMGLRRDMDN
jgi:hypothetical protein